jgi:hypothetical protein
MKDDLRVLTTSIRGNVQTTVFASGMTESVWYDIVTDRHKAIWALGDWVIHDRNLTAKKMGKLGTLRKKALKTLAQC